MGYAAWSLRSFQREEPSKAARYARYISYAADVAHPIGVAMRLIIEAAWRRGKRVRLKRRPLLWSNEMTGASPTWDLHLPKAAPCSLRFSRCWCRSRLPGGWKANWFATVVARC